MAKIGFPKGSGKRLKVREKSVKSQGILKWILSGNPEFYTVFHSYDESIILMKLHYWINYKSVFTVKPVLSGHSKLNKHRSKRLSDSLMKVESIAECFFGAFCNTFDCSKRSFCNTFDLH